MLQYEVKQRFHKEKSTIKRSVQQIFQEIENCHNDQIYILQNQLIVLRKTVKISRNWIT